VRPEDFPDMLGPERGAPERTRTALPPGVATGLAWTEAGGEILYVEASRLPDPPRLRLTGQLGKVMRESAKTAHSFVWSHARELGIDPDHFRGGVHVHVPAGAGPQGRPRRPRARRAAPAAPLPRDAGPQRHGDERRDHADRAGDADRRREGEGAGGPAGRNPAGDPAEGQREGSAGVARRRPLGDDVLPGGDGRTGTGRGDDAPAER